MAIEYKNSHDITGINFSAFETDQQTQKFCPFQPIITETDDSGNIVTISGMFCLKEKCMAWQPDTFNADPFQLVTNTINPFSDIGNTNDDSGDCGLKSRPYVELLYKLAHHTHFQHAHPFSHDATTTSDLEGRLFKANELVQEYLNNEKGIDGKTYGIDYIIEDNTSKPLILTNLEASLPPKTTRKVPWDNYFNDDSGPYYPVQISNVYPHEMNISGRNWFRIKGHFIVEDGIGFYIDVDAISCDYLIASEELMYVRMPAGLDTTGFVSITINNTGDTFNVGRITGKVRTFLNKLKVIESGDDEDIQQDIIDEIFENTGIWLLNVTFGNSFSNGSLHATLT